MTLGLPALWNRVSSWLFGNEPVIPEFKTPLEDVGLKCTEIPKLNSYSGPQSKSFCDNFPKKLLPSSTECSIKTDILEKIVINLSDKLTECELERAVRSLENLRSGANVFQKEPLPACVCDNAKSAVQNGRNVTDVVGNWIKKGFVAGPFDGPPLPKFRVNSLMAIKQGHKVRPVLNVSLPKLASLNDNVNKLAVEKVKM